MELWLIELLEAKYNATIVGHSQESAAAKGESYGSDTYRMKVTFQHPDGQQFPKSFIIKAAPKSQVSKQMLEDYGCFESEINVYTNILPRMEEHFKGDSGSIPWCEYIGHHMKDVIVLEDLKECGFQGCPRMKGLDLEHAKVALHGLGIYHGLSVRLSKEKYPFPIMNLVQDKPEPKRFLKGAFQVCADAVDRWGSEWVEVGNKLRKEADLAFHKLQELANPPEGSLVVLNHGDCWTCNMMFSYKPDGSPDKVKFFDFQTPHWNSIGWDMYGILACSVQPEVRRRNWSLLVETYSNAIASTMKTSCIRGELIPTCAQVLKELERLNYHMFVCMVGMYPICSGESGGYDPEKNIEGSSCSSLSPSLYGERYKIAVQDDLWNFHVNRTF